MFSFDPTIINKRNRLKSLLFSSAPIISAPKYSSHFFNYISSNINTTSLEIIPCNFQDLAYFTTPSCPLVIFVSRDKKGYGNSFINSQYVCKEV